MRSTQISKIWMALTGTFLCLFLVIHLLGNLQLLLPADRARASFNWYSHLLSGNVLIKLIEWLLFVSILAHIVYALLLTLRARKASGRGYVYDKRKASSTWNSRNMGFLGMIILLFLVLHLKDFWYRYKFGNLPLDEQGYTDLYAIVVAAYEEFWYVLLYLAGIAALGFHLLHGFSSAARTLGLYHPLYSKVVRVAGKLYTLAITAGFMIIPVYIYFNKA
ncbi:succinate dehydrogenase cytochrome b subunit [Taibaiella chishuiensis]|nr:succinate dehydrogenase cytochrome b subunit [Taibaiella chishuiensis]